MKTLEHLSFQEIYDYVNSFEVVLKNKVMSHKILWDYP